MSAPSPDTPHTNRLANALSPYLRMHARNPVDWYPWGPEAFEKARRENKPLIISIGYAACHWCHVMEEESFSDSEVAALMNQYFVSVKVDREEMPDVDDYYMNAVQLMTGRGGWPLNVIALPDGRPFYGGTYFPKHQWIRLLKAIVRKWKTEPETVKTYAARLQQGIRQINPIVPAPQAPPEYSPASLQKWYAAIRDELDPQWGGFNRAPRFPMPVVFRFLLRYHLRTNDATARNLTLLTLRKMRQGGIYDRLGGGFARYSTDARWKVPHFEKMLYDNAQLALLYTEAYQLTRQPWLKETALETIRFMIRELGHPHGGFYASLDADSEGEEGRFYVWTTDQVRRIVGEEDFPIVKKYFGLDREARWEHGKNVLLVAHDAESLARTFHRPVDEIRRILRHARQRLFEARSQRVRPATDDKIIFSWNCLVLEALYQAYLAYDDPALLEAAEKTFRFLADSMISNDGQRIYHVYRGGRRHKTDLLEDYVGWMRVLLARYDALFTTDDLRQALMWAEEIPRRFGAPNSPILLTGAGKDIPLNTAEVSDNVIPSFNSQYAEAAYRLGTLTFNKTLIRRADTMLGAVLPFIDRSPSFHAGWLILYSEFLDPFYEVAIVGPDARRHRIGLEKEFFPFKICGGCTRKQQCTWPEVLFNNRWMENKTLIYPCVRGTCLMPASEPATALHQMKQSLQNSK